MDLSKASKNTRQIYRALGMTPLGNAANLSIVTGIDEHKVANVLRRGELGSHGRRKDAQMKGDDGEVDLLFSVKMGRVRKATRRYAYTYAGLLECNRVLGVQQDDCKVRKLVSRGGRWSALGGRHRSWPARAWTSWEETIPPGAGRSAQC